MKENNIVTLNGENGKSLDFRIEAELEYDGYLYQILRPLKKYNDLNDEAIVFRVEYTSNYGYEYFVEEDDEIISQIEKIYNSEL
ncbi:MAG: DUF1292 domain-containing protein [Acholeplasmatales bacterium]|jgi:hypothetical protein|nr:DUF1292 domain-containing protein [Acholeplasmatales bacterium]